MALHQQTADEVGGNLLGQNGCRRRIGRGLGGLRWSWWLWEWLCEEVLRDADRRVVAGL
jgi:hypothetical protein